MGALVLKRDRSYKRPPITPLMYGGQQERGFRPGTTPVALVAGFALAAELCDDSSERRMNACQQIKTDLIDALKGIDYVFNGDQGYCIPSTANISFKGVDAEALFLATKDDYSFSNGSACNSGSHKPSYVLTAMGLPEERISEAVRLSWDEKTQVDFSKLAKTIRTIQ